MGILFWIIFFVVLVIIEAITLGLTTVWFAAGALVSAILSLFVEDMAWLEWTVFAAVSGFALFLIRPMVAEKMQKVSEKNANKTGIDTYIGKKAKVTEAIDNLNGGGRVDFNGQSWAAISTADGRKIEKDALVVIRDIKGVKMIVEEL